jgi:hypothetical protein
MAEKNKKCFFSHLPSISVEQLLSSIINLL